MRPSGSIPVFIETARDLQARLTGHDGEQALALAAKAAECLQTFQTWADDPPSPEERSLAVRRLLDLQREVTKLVGTSWMPGPDDS